MLIDESDIVPEALALSYLHSQECYEAKTIITIFSYIQFRRHRYIGG